MKKIINLLLVVCLMASVICVSALAEETTYTGPQTHTYPTIIDFNDEEAGTGANGVRYYDLPLEPKHFYYFEGYTAAHLVSEEPNEVEMETWSTAAVSAANGIKFDDFEYDSSLEKQAEKLVVSVDVKYTDLDDDDKDWAELGYDHRHIYFGYKALDTTTVGTIKTSSSDSTKIAWFGNGLSANDKLNGTDDEYFFNWSGTVDVDTDQFTGAVYNNGVALDATALNNQAFKTMVNAGEWLTYTYVMDLTRDENGKGNVIVYVDNEKTDALVSREAEVDKINFMMFSINRSRKFRYDNVRIYTIDNDKIAATGQSVATTDVPLTTKEVTVNFSHEITAAADNEIIVKKGSEVLVPVEDYTIEHVVSETGAKTAKAFKVKFTDTLSYGTTYTIGGSEDYFGIDGYALEEETTFASFTTEAAPQINLSDLEIKKGFYGNIDVTSFADVLGSTVNVTTTATNGEASGEAVGTVFFGVYKNGVLVNLAFVGKTFAEGESDEISVSLDLPAADESDVVEIKAFACEGLGNLDAYGTIKSISSAE